MREIVHDLAIRSQTIFMVASISVEINLGTRYLRRGKCYRKDHWPF